MLARELVNDEGFLPSKVQEQLSSHMLEAMADPGFGGAFDEAFAHPIVRWASVVHWALVQIVGTVLILGCIKVLHKIHFKEKK